MRKSINSRRLLTISSILFACSVILITIVISCRKISQQAEEVKADDLAVKFFTAHSSSDPVIAAAAQFVKHQNEKYKFLTNLTKRIGFPYWDKSMVFSKLYSAKGSSADSENIIYIPFARDSEEIVNTALIINMKPTDTTFRFLYDWQYAAYGFDTVSNTEKWNARDVFHIFTLFDKEVFNINQFWITDKNLLSSSEKESIKSLGLNVDSVQILSTLKEEGQRGSVQQKMMPIEICNTYSICIQPCLKAFRGSSLNKAQTDDCCQQTFEWKECTTYYIDDGSGSDIPPPPTNSGSGGGTGDPGNGWSDPCAGSGGVPRGETGQPCGGDPGWQPITTETDPDLDPASYPETTEILLFEQDYRTKMSQQELVIFDDMPRLKQLQYLFNAKSALDWAQSLYPNSVHNGNGDAFRHAYFSAMNAKVLGVQLAKQLGDAHETFPNSNPLENQMDLFNNQYGRDLFAYLSQNGMGGSFFKETVIGLLRNLRIPNGELRKLSPLGPNSEILPNSQLVPTD